MKFCSHESRCGDFERRKAKGWKRIGAGKIIFLGREKRTRVVHWGTRHPFIGAHAGTGGGFANGARAISTGKMPGPPDAVPVGSSLAVSFLIERSGKPGAGDGGQREQDGIPKRTKIRIDC